MAIHAPKIRHYFFMQNTPGDGRGLNTVTLEKTVPAEILVQGEYQK